MMKLGKQGPENISQHSRRTIIERNLTKAGIYPQKFSRPRIQLPDFPRSPTSEAPPEDDILLPDEIEADNDPTDPKLIRDSSAAQVKIPR